jgi:MinD-like ATPase involved in chromosome partitioning or flagellar assembly
VLIGRAAVEDVVQPLGTTSLDLLPAGQIPPSPSELLGSMTMAVLLERLSAVYDIVLLGSPPLLPVTDAVVLSKMARALVVVGADRIHRPQLQAVLGIIRNGRSAHFRTRDEQDRRPRGCGVRVRLRISLLCTRVPKLSSRSAEAAFGFG